MGAITADEAARWRREQERAGRRVALTNGCFDLLHAGHVRLLTAARGAADALVVALNDDASVRRLKGQGRPLVPEDERAELLAALEAVDRVVLFAEPTPREIVLRLRPDVLVKGADWAVDEIVGAREVRSWGGEVVRAPMVAGASTTGLVEEIRRRYGERG
ncbi:MAG: D-glycero-beta-D-manno-heptose 1-phosphate adenylyltransferase [Acidobacteriota bacterium]|nr:D-glycero-beta-D-manno-heptose 1-phosphate adenylyltransferase [Acidobacteriota bacterium]